LSASSDMLLITPILIQPLGSSSNETGIVVSLRSGQHRGENGAVRNIRLQVCEIAAEFIDEHL
jgi:hypothetical protein